MLRPYQNPTASTSTLLAQTLRRFFRRPLLHPPVLPELGDGRAHVVRDLALLAPRRDHRLRLLGLELERPRQLRLDRFPLGEPLLELRHALLRKAQGAGTIVQLIQRRCQLEQAIARRATAVPNCDERSSSCWAADAAC